jgi:hypothetical protein
MCDYSLHNVASRPAVVADKLISTKFKGTDTRGFCAPGEPHVAVCVRPGTELAFETEVTYRRLFGLLRGRTGQRLARFREINANERNAHHDALEFPDARIVLVHDLTPGQGLVVLQMPNEAGRVIDHAREEPRVSRRLSAG